MRLLDDLQDALAVSITGKRQLSITVVGAVVSFVVFMLLTYPAYARQLLGSSLFYLDDAVIALSLNLQQAAGTIGLVLVGVYAVLIGATFSVLLLQFQVSGVRAVGGGVGVVPGLIASGCASCGVGLLSVLGFAGVISMLPFHGNGVRLVGIVIMLYVLARLGDPRHCDIDL